MASTASLARRLLRARAAISHAWIASASYAVCPLRPVAYGLSASSDIFVNDTHVPDGCSVVNERSSEVLSLHSSSVHDNNLRMRDARLNELSEVQQGSHDEQSTEQTDASGANGWKSAMWRGTWDDPIPIASAIGATERLVACSGRHAARHHPTLYMVVKAGEPRACEHPDCGQVFKLTDRLDRDYTGSK